MNNRSYQELFSISPDILTKVNRAEEKLENTFKHLEDIRSYNQLKVLKAFQVSELSQSDFFSATGYGYGDTGREKTERVFQEVFRSEDALVRPSIASGTHALAIVLFSLLQHGDFFLSATGLPYDTLLEVIGYEGEEVGSLKEKGIVFDFVDLMDGSYDEKKLREKLQKKPKLVEIQRSTGYSDRRAFNIQEIEEMIQIIREESPSSIIMVDNCYGEFTEKKEPIEVGADIIAGSLIKNPGGGIAVSGGYIVGKKDLIERCANHHTAPGLGKDTGLTFHTTRLTLQGFFLAPHITIEALKAAYLFGQVFSNEGYKVIPGMDDPRSDIIQAIEFQDPDKVIAFCRGIQEGASIGAMVVPYPWDMPGYIDQVIMASGGFIDGSSIEVSADGPLREPYIAYYQGGIVYEQAKLACMKSLEKLEKC